jgi:hypothetical protein
MHSCYCSGYLRHDPAALGHMSTPEEWVLQREWDWACPCPSASSTLLGVWFRTAVCRKIKECRFMLVSAAVGVFMNE